DVTGYGLLGHLREMLNASGVSAEVYADEVPALPEVWSLIAADEVPGGTERNLASLEGDVRWHPAVDRPARVLLADAQTSGGLLIAIPPEDEAALRQALARAGAPAAATVGRITARDTSLMYVRPMDAADDFDD
ncbi:MAG: AIR synthase-related protein, partial [Chloroflexota bacterium]|nr:AIR synthase-related protein [Chloroflexota bacterium]